MEQTLWDVIIIGGGPAGLSAAVYGKRAGLAVLVVEKSYMPGGQVLTTYEVDNYLGLPGINGFDMGVKFKEHADRLGAQFLEVDVVSIEETTGEEGPIFVLATAEGETLKAKSLVIATGATHRKVGIPGEEELAGMGVSYCATCDGAFFKGKTTTVIGGGDVAVEDAIFLAGLCEKVYLVHRRDELRAARRLQEQLFALPNVELVWDSVPVSIEGTDQVEGLKVYNKKTDQESILATDGVFVAVGIIPITELVGDMVKKDSQGYIVAGEDGITSHRGIFVAGDARTKKMRQIVTAVADGAMAIQSATEYLNER